MATRIGFVGTGGIAGHHFNNLKDIEGVELAAFTDLDASRAQAAADRFKGKAYASAEEMYDKSGIEAVFICVPPFAHGPAELAAAERKLPMFLEKPVGVKNETAHEITAAIEKAGVASAVGYHWRYQDSTDRAHEILKDKTIGMVMGYWMGGFPGVPWWRVRAQSGGQMVEQTTHIVDLARYLAGDVVEVYAAYGTRALGHVPNFDVGDVGTATLKFASGAVGTINNSCLLNVGYTTALHILTPDVILEINGGLKILEGQKTTQMKNSSNPTRAEEEAFIHAVRTGDRSKIRSDYADAARTLAVTLACNESADTGQPVKIAAR